MLTKNKLDDFLTIVCYSHILTTKYEGYVIPEDDPVSKLSPQLANLYKHFAAYKSKA
jgi:hypothetical protein